MPDFSQLTHRQKEIYEFIRDKIESRGYGPTVREIGLGFDIKSPNGVMCHLKALEKWGIVKAGQARADGRDRPWKAVGRTIEVDSAAPASTALAEAAILGTFLDRNRAIAIEYLQQEENEPQRWRDRVELAAGDYWLTADELEKAARAIRDVLEPYSGRRRDSRPADSRRVRIARIVVPRTEPASSPRPGPPDPAG